MSDKLNHFLLIFDHNVGELVDVQEFGSNTLKAMAAYSSEERKHLQNDLIEVVLLGSDSLETIRVTHGNYFDGSAAIGGSKLLEDAYSLIDEVRGAQLTGNDPAPYEV